MAKALKKKKKTVKRKKPAARKPAKKKTVKKKATAKRRPAKRKATKRKATKKKTTKRKAPARKKAAKKKPAKKKKTSKKPARKKTTKKTARKAPAKKPAKKKKAAPKKKPKVFVYNMYDLKKPKATTSAEVNTHRKLSGKSTTEACNIKGAQMQVGIAHKRMGTGSKLHTHPNEQFNFVLKGTLVVDIDGQRKYCPAGSVVHIPAGTVHGTCASEEGDVIFYVCKDNRHGMAGPPIDGKEDGARYLPGFEPTEAERALDADKTRKVSKIQVN